MNTRRSFFRVAFGAGAGALAATATAAIAKPTALAKLVDVPKPGYRFKIYAISGWKDAEAWSRRFEHRRRSEIPGKVIFEGALSMVRQFRDDRVLLVHTEPIEYHATECLFVTRAQVWDGEVLLGEEWQGRTLMADDTLCFPEVSLSCSKRTVEIARRILAA